MKGEDRDASGDKKDNEVLVERVALSEYCEVKEHYGEKLAGFGKDVGNVVDVGEGGVSKGRGKGGCYGDEEERKEDMCGREDGRYAGGGAVGGNEVDVAGEGGKAGLDGVEEYGVFELCEGGRGTVRGGEDTFLEDGPGKAGTS